MSRKSVRKYLEKPVEEEKVQILLKAGMAAPTGKDVRPWEFVVVTERSLLDAMAEALPYAKMLKQAPLAIVVCPQYLCRRPYLYAGRTEKLYENRRRRNLLLL